MIAGQAPYDPPWTEVIFAAKMKDLLLDLRRSAIGMPLRNRWPVHQTGLTVFTISLTPSIQATAADTKISTRLRNVTGVISVLKNTKFACDLALILAHEHLLCPTIASLMEMSREYRHIYKAGVVDALEDRRIRVLVRNRSFVPIGIISE